MSIMSVFRWFRALIRWLCDLVSDPGSGSGGEEPTDPTDVYDIIIYHYGCPNSKRTEKLQLKKQGYRS